MHPARHDLSVRRLRVHPSLNLKSSPDYGDCVRHKIAGREELSGTDVIIVHRLMKNSVAETTGVQAYALSRPPVPPRWVSQPRCSRCVRTKRPTSTSVWCGALCTISGHGGRTIRTTGESSLRRRTPSLNRSPAACAASGRMAQPTDPAKRIRFSPAPIASMSRMSEDAGALARPTTASTDRASFRRDPRLAALRVLHGTCDGAGIRSIDLHVLPDARGIRRRVSISRAEDSCQEAARGLAGSRAFVSRNRQAHGRRAHGGPGRRRDAGGRRQHRRGESQSLTREARRWR